MKTEGREIDSSKVRGPLTSSKEDKSNDEDLQKILVMNGCDFPYLDMIILLVAEKTDELGKKLNHLVELGYDNVEVEDPRNKEYWEAYSNWEAYSVLLEDLILSNPVDAELKRILNS